MKKTGQDFLTTEFDKIDKEYEAFYNGLMKGGLFPFGKTDSGYWGPSILKYVFSAFKKIELSKYRNFADLGSGDGSVVLAASLFTNAAGFELDEDLFKKSIKFKNELVKKVKLNKVKFYNKNYLNENLSKYDVVYHYPDNGMHEVENKLLKEMRKDAILIHYGNRFFPLQLKKIKGFDFDGIKITVYRKCQEPPIKDGWKDVKFPVPLYVGGS